MRISLAQQLRKYFIMGSQNCEQDPVTILESAAKAGITAFQFREKGIGSLAGDEKLKLGKKLRQICREYHILFIVNDDVELVDLLDADGIHVGQADQSVTELRKQYPDKLIGLSVSNRTEVENSPTHLVDYLGAGPIYGTTTKSDAKTPVGTEWIRTLRNQFPNIPIVGIGGINTSNASSVIHAGANGVAVISSITQATNIVEAVKKL
ncbi:thiamine phosphate synthase [Ornithinibacillus salinisoli]|uniref:Thiamine-phosphate synthase n=1 Tax=Ornithinibacillus salinisoli TaxID=1848459 RepID=A0ABW4VX38_9BACI